MRDWVVFDAMGVIFPAPDDVRELLVPFLRKKDPELSVETLEEAYRRASLGRIEPAGFWAAIGFGEEYPGIEEAYLDSCLEPDPGFLPLARRLAGRVELGLVSNDVGAWSRRLRETWGLEALFRTATISGDAGFRKPDERIFRAFLEKSGAAAERCVFIDDRLRNLAPAKGLGMRTVLFDKSLPDSTGYRPDAVARGYPELEATLERFLGA
jgi:putative hydrolase of the HAD superfamily